MKLCFATNNQDKIREISALLDDSFEIVSLQDIGCPMQLPENQKTIEGNSFEKADFVYKNFQVNCLADDTGLEVFELDGEPGVHSARYAGEQRSSEDNIDLLLTKLDNSKDRRSQFKTIVTVVVEGKAKQFEGIVKGAIGWERSGEGGFGYDPIFIPEGQEKTFAEMSLAEKNEISHRGKAIRKLAKFLKNRG